MRLPHGTPELKFIRLWLLACLVSLCGGVLAGIVIHSQYFNQPHVDLPEAYRLIKPTDVLRGRYDCKSNTVTIEFDNSQK